MSVCADGRDGLFPSRQIDCKGMDNPKKSQYSKCVKLNLQMGIFAIDVYHVSIAILTRTLAVPIIG